MISKELSVIWCDDIRAEIGDKLSFMGVYTGAILVPSQPFTLARLGIWARLSVDKNDPVTALSAKVQFDNGQLIFEIPTQTHAPQTPDDNPRKTMMNYIFGVQIAPIVVPVEASYFEFIIKANDETLSGIKLWIERIPEKEKIKTLKTRPPKTDADRDHSIEDAAVDFRLPR